MYTLFSKKNSEINMQSGAALITAVIFFVALTSIVATGISGPVVRDIRIIESAENSRKSFSVSESAIEDVAYRLKTGKTVSDVEVLTIASTTATTTIATDPISGEKQLVSVGDSNRAVRTTSIALITGSGTSFNYGVQTGEGGLELQNSATILGNVHSSGPIVGTGNTMVGTLISAGPEGLVEDLYVIGDVHAHTIKDSIIFGDAYYQTITNTFVSGEEFSGSDDQATSTLPISDAQIDEWEAEAEAGGIISTPCPYKIEDATTLGPIKIICDLEISGNNYEVTLEGHVWVTGDIIIKNSPTIKVADSLGATSVAIIADNPSDRLDSSMIKIDNSVEFEGSGSGGSYVLVISENESISTGGSNTAVDISNSTDGDLLVYSARGEILLQNSIGLAEVTGYKVRLKNSATITYESGLVNLLFTSGPSGGFVIKSWGEAE
ncbi:hypothetical protein COB55_02595 [Candidatus Wolfebacteria bacterium]|nr:MAG: hypothetical protein COB55_02595 [Candidatus Wolfebacteria bacterium]